MTNGPSPWIDEPPLMPNERRPFEGDDAYVSRLTAQELERHDQDAAKYGLDPVEERRNRPAYVAEHVREEVAASVADERQEPSVNGRFRSARELVNATPAAIDYVIRPWCAHGTITEIDGKPKSAGKTTLVLHAIAAVLDGKPFLGEPTTRGPVVLLTEQSAASIAPSLRALRLDRDELSVLTWPDAFGTPWAEIVQMAEDECSRLEGYERTDTLLVVDTLPQFAGVRGDSENDAGAALEAMAPLQRLAGTGRSILVTRHDRKAGGDVGESGRGSNAWSGAVDCIVALRRPLNPVRASIREIEAISRRGDVPTEPVMIELTDAGYVVLGSESAVAFGEAREAILGVLADGQSHVEKEMIEAAGEASRSTVRDALAALVSAGTVEKGLRKKVTEPYPYRLLSLTTVVPSSSRPLTVYNRLSTDAATLEDDYPASAFEVLS